MFINTKLSHLLFAAFTTCCLPMGKVALSSDAPIPYKWGVYNATKADGGKIVIIDWNSKEGLARLERSKFKNDFYQLAHFYQPTANPVFATIASAVTVLNGLRIPTHTLKSQDALEIAKPKALGGGILPFPSYSQTTFLNEETDKIKDRKLILLQNITPENENNKESFRPGLGLEDLKAMLEKVYHAHAAITYGNEEVDVGSKRFRERLKKVLADSNTFIISNFRGDAFGANNEGTMSPLVAYDQKTDSVLILDTGAHKNPWYWVPLKSLYRGMNIAYGANFRGYIEVTD